MSSYHPNQNSPPPSSSSSSSSYKLVKWMILRLLGFVYTFVFLAAYFQNEGLFSSSSGLTPITHNVMSQLHQKIQAKSSSSLSSSLEGFLQFPTLFWFLTPTDDSLFFITIFGFFLSILLLFGCNSWFILFLLWLLHFSIVTVASISGSFYSYGWESQLLETGFLAIFLCDLPSLSIQETTRLWKDKCIILDKTWKFSSLWKDDDNTKSSLFTTITNTSDPSSIILFLMQWLIFRISIGAGLIKIRGSTCWTEKTCLWYHFETQPLPSPFSFIFHFLPKHILSKAVDLDLIVQVYFAWLTLIPPMQMKENSSLSSSLVLLVLRWLRRIGGLIQISFMIMILLSGNFSILNHLTIIPALACLDDVFLLDLFFLRKKKTNHRISSLQHPQQDDLTNTRRKDDSPPPRTLSTTTTITIRPCRASYYTRFMVDISLFCTIAYLSIPVVSNLLQWKGQSQQMNASYDPFRLVNTYGAFGSVGTARYEPIISISYNDLGDYNRTTWYEIDLPCKPGTVTRRPCFCAPYHYRLDWNIWFIGFKPHKAYLYQRESWLFTLLEKMLQPPESSSSSSSQKTHKRPWLKLLDTSASKYFPPQSPINPKAVKVEMFHYKMRKPLWILIRDNMLGKDNGKVIWWDRKFEEILIEPLKWDHARKQLVFI